MAATIVSLTIFSIGVVAQGIVSVNPYEVIYGRSLCNYNS